MILNAEIKRNFNLYSIVTFYTIEPNNLDVLSGSIIKL